MMILDAIILASIIICGLITLLGSLGISLLSLLVLALLVVLLVVNYQTSPKTST